MASSWRVAYSLETLITEVDSRWPNRNRVSDGTKGDERHERLGSASDHNPWIKVDGIGVVRAFDLTHDPDNGVNNHDIVELLKHDPRLHYVIWNRRIWNASIAKRWRPYSGSNPHTRHAHFSVSRTRSLFDDPSDWFGELTMLRRGMENKYVGRLQQWLTTAGFRTKVDNDFGPATEKSLKEFQEATWLIHDVEPGVYDSLFTAPQLAARVEAVRNKTHKGG